jgi:DNA-binding response OmpR family regulator
MNNIFLAEDDPVLGPLLKEYLDKIGFSVDLYHDGYEALRGFSASGYNLCIIDVMMPVKDGFTLAKSIRNISASIPIIFLTARSRPEDKIKGFKIGADDYITKPFNMEELELRINAIMKRCLINKEPSGEQLLVSIGNFNFDYSMRFLSINGQVNRLSKKEAELLKLLYDNKNVVVKREYILRQIWDHDDYYTARSMDVYIAKLRKYLKEDKDIEIQNIHGTGFKLVMPEQ